MNKIKKFFEFKNSDKIIRIINVVFLIIFIILLFVPISKINMSEKSKQENRYLAKFPTAYTKQGGFNVHIGQDFDAWLNDRFNMRYELIKLNRLYSCIPNVNYCLYNDDVFDKRNNILYKYSFFGLTDLNKKKNYDIVKASENIQKLNDWCKAHNIKLYILIAPRQSDFVKYNVPDRRYRNVNDIGEEIVKYAKEHTDVNIIFPYEEMMKANKKNPAFYKTDHHWTHTGAYAGYLALMKEIKKDFPDVKIMPEADLKKSTNKMVKTSHKSIFNFGSILRNSGIPDWYSKRIMNTDYIYYSNSKYEDIHISKESNLPDFDKRFDGIYQYDKGSNIKAVFIANSYGGNLLEFLPYSFKEILSMADNYRNLYFTKYEKIVSAYKPDIMIINIHTVNTVIFYNLFKESKGEI